ncbi:MAG: glutaminyl-peptide cyclotransferase [Balneolaceae bacterium]
MLKGKWILLLMGTLLLAMMPSFPGSERLAESQSITNYDWRVVRVYPHDRDAFTQGLIYRDGYLYESTGRRGQSTLRKVRLETGEVLQQRDVEDEYFAEGLTDWNDRLIQLTLSSNIGFVYDLESFERTGEFNIPGNGWGLTHDGEQLIMSDGSSVLSFLDPETFEETRQVEVTEDGEPVKDLNELEMIKGKIFANILFSEKIIEIDPENGRVTGRIDLRRLVTMVKRETSVNTLNGIAWDAENDRIFVTGKLYPNVFEIEIR